MLEFKIGKDVLKREAKVRLLSWGTVLIMLLGGVVLLALRVSGHISDSSNLGDVVVLMIVGPAVIAIVLAPREGQRRVERKMVFALDDTRIVRRMQGHPDIEIAFSEIETLREELRWLVITTAEPRRKIAVPNDVNGYELLRAELVKHHPTSARPRIGK